jgi:outer membrane protein assembly factor BamB
MASEDVNPDASPSEKKPAAPAPRRRRLFPPLWVWVVVAVCAGAIAFAQRPGTYDHQMANIASLVIAATGIGTLVLWFALLSGYAFGLRMLLLAAAIVGPIVFLSLFRVEAVSGELVPRFTYRFAPKPDELLATPDAGTTEPVDLSPTPHDFPQFLGPGRDASYAAVQLARDWSTDPPQKMWRQPIGAGWSAFAAVNGFAVTMEQRGEMELVTCHEVETGALRWSHGIKTRHESVLGGVGPRGTPTIHEGKVYALGATGKLRCLDGADGSAVWTKDLFQEVGVSEAEDVENVRWGRAASPLVVDHLVVVPAGGPTKNPVSLIAYDRDTGEEVWRGGERHISLASPSLATLAGVRQIVIVNEDTVSGHAVETGATLWSYPWPGKSNMDANASQAAAISGDRLIVSKGYGGGVLVVQVGLNGGQWSVAEVWRDRGLLKTKFANLAVRDGYAYGLSDGILECVDLSDGSRMWKKGRYGHGQGLLAADVLLVQAESGEVAMVEATPEEFRELGRFPAIQGKTWNNLCLYGPFLLTRNGEEAACYKLPLAK